MGNRKKGQGLVEFALILPVLLLVLMGIIEFGYVFAAYTSLFNAAREGSRYGAVRPLDPGGIETSARGKIFLVNSFGPAVNVCCDNPGELEGTFYCNPTITHIWTCDHATRSEAMTGGSTGAITVTNGARVGDRVVISLTYDLPTITPLIHPLFPSLAVQTQSARTIASLGEAGSGPPLPPGGDPSLPPGTEICDNGIDDDEDGATDCDDLDCTGHPACGGSPPGEVEICDNGIDDDLDSMVDCYDYDCIGDPACAGSLPEDCSNGVDDDGDGATDCDDDDCAADPACVNPPEICDNGVDDNANGLVDCDDPGCLSEPVCFDPIRIFEPAPGGGLFTGQTVVTGTAEPETTVFIYDPQDPSVTGNSNVGLDGTFSFVTPPLQAGHVVVVSGYSKWDSAPVGGASDPITIDAPCHDDLEVSGTAEPNAIVNLSIASIGYQQGVRAGADGRYVFTLYGGVTLVVNQELVVYGYGMGASATVGWCGTNPYITIGTWCGDPNPNMIILVSGENWVASGNHEVRLYWGSETTEKAIVPLGNGEGSFANQPIQVNVPGPGQYTIRAELWKNNPTGTTSQASFRSPCPRPNLQITDLTLATSEPISMYQEIAFDVTVLNAGQLPINSLFWTDIFTRAPSIAPDTGLAWGAASALDPGNSVVVRIALQSGFAATGTYQVWALTDSWGQVAEFDETDNIFGPLSVFVTVEDEPPPLPGGTGTISGTTMIHGPTGPVPHGRANVWAYNIDTHRVVASATSDADGLYGIVELPAGSYLIMASTWMDGVYYFGIHFDTVYLEEGEVETSINVVMH